MEIDSHQKIGAILDSDKSEIRSRDAIALEKMKALERKFKKKMHTVYKDNMIIETTKKVSDFETYNPYLNL